MKSSTILIHNSHPRYYTKPLDFTVLMNFVLFFCTTDRVEYDNGKYFYIYM